jgi:death-on-curing protein
MIPCNTIEPLGVADFLVIAEAILGIDAHRLARAADLPGAESALAAPFAGFADTDFYPDPATKAAILCSRLVRNHPLPDGNKRVAYLAMREFLARNRIEWQRPDDEDATAEAIERLAARETSEEDFAAWVARGIR